jgi:ABC-type oligopeptide transport system ATPase subunit
MALLQASHLTKVFTRGTRLTGRSIVRAVDDVSFAIDEGETFGLVGESGSGKSTTGRMLVRLIEPTSGSVSFRGQDLLALDARALREIRREIQMVFQDPYASLNPRLRVLDLVAEPLAIHRIGSSRSRIDRVAELLTLVGLDAGYLERYPAELSGGQRQRIGLARALALEPRLIVLDEPVSALDVSVQAQILRVFVQLRARLGLTYLFISHDLRVVAQLCDRVACMCGGRIVELGAAARVLTDPVHPYTQALVSAVPSGDPDRRGQRTDWPIESLRRDLPLRPIGQDHWAAI